MAPKPKYVSVVLSGDLPIAVFRDAPAALEYAQGLRDEGGSFVYSVMSVRLYEYKVGPMRESGTEAGA